MKSPPPLGLFKIKVSLRLLAQAPDLSFASCSYAIRGSSPNPQTSTTTGGAGRSKPDGVGVAAGGGVDVLPGKRFLETTNSHHFQKELASQLGGYFPVHLLFCVLLEQKIHEKIAASFQNEYKSRMQNLPSVSSPGPARNMALGRNLNAAASF